MAGVFRPDGFEPDVPESTVLIQALRAGVKDFLRRPVSSSELAELLRRLQRSPVRDPGRIGRVVSFVSNKGGVGKSTLAVNAACGLAVHHPQQVLLVDASLQMGVCASLLDLTPAASLTDVVREARRLDETLIRQLASRTPAVCTCWPRRPTRSRRPTSTTRCSRGSSPSPAGRTASCWSTPSPCSIGRCVAVLDLSDRVYVVLENVVPTLLGAVKLIEVLRGLGLSAERQRIVLNRYTRLPGSVGRRKPPTAWAMPSITSFPSTSGS